MLQCKLWPQEEQQKTKKKKKSTKKKPVVVEEPKSQDSSSPEHNVDSQDGSLTDHELNTGTTKAGGPQPMAPGVFLSHRRPSMSSPSSNNNSTNSLSATTNTTNNSSSSSSLAKGERLGAADAKGGQLQLQLHHSSFNYSFNYTTATDCYLTPS